MEGGPRDVKPANVLLGLDGTPKLTDFDLVRALDSTGGTRTGMLGTFLYAAPEAMMRAQEAGRTADVYGLGSVLVYVPGGEFTLGADDIGDEERPVHRVRLSPFWIGKFSVTNEQYGRYLEACGEERRKPRFWNDKRFNGPQQPVIGRAVSERVRVDARLQTLDAGA